MSYRTSLGAYGMSTSPNSTTEVRVSDDPEGQYSSDPMQATVLVQRLLAKASSEVENASLAVNRNKRLDLEPHARWLRGKVEDLRAQAGIHPAAEFLPEVQKAYQEISESAGALKAVAERMTHGPAK